jgi:DNA polymerase III delta subunit
MSDNTIRLVEVQETEWGEKVVLDSPYESRNYIKHLPFVEYAEELDRHGSLRAKASDRGMNIKSSAAQQLFDSIEQYGFSDDFAAHSSWNPDALDGDGAWMIDKDAVEEAVDFWQFCGFHVEGDVDL